MWNITFSKSKLNIITIKNQTIIHICFPGSNPGGDVDPCGTDRPMRISNSTTGEILSPNHPDQYPNTAECEWHINVDDGFVVKLTFLAFDVEEG